MSEGFSTIFSCPAIMPAIYQLGIKAYYHSLWNTIEFMGIWEEMYNPIFNFPEFEGINKEAGLNRFVMSVKQWMNKTNAIGIVAKSGRYFM